MAEVPGLSYSQLEAKMKAEGYRPVSEATYYTVRRELAGVEQVRIVRVLKTAERNKYDEMFERINEELAKGAK